MSKRRLDPILSPLGDPGVPPGYPEESPRIHPGCHRSCSVEIDSESTQMAGRNVRQPPATKRRKKKEDFCAISKWVKIVRRAMLAQVRMQNSCAMGIADDVHRKWKGYGRMFFVRFLFGSGRH